MSDTMPKMPPLDPKRMLSYDAIRYVAGFPESYVHEYARAYALQVAEEAALIADAAAGSIAQNIDEMYVALNIGAAIRARFPHSGSAQNLPEG